jgi:hypothetical protein
VLLTTLLLSRCTAGRCAFLSHDSGLGHTSKADAAACHGSSDDKGAATTIRQAQPVSPSATCTCYMSSSQPSQHGSGKSLACVGLTQGVFHASAHHNGMHVCCSAVSLLPPPHPVLDLLAA